MSIQSVMPCWEIMQCNKKERCFFAGDKKKACWELVRENDATLFHICVDCLVYMAKHEDSTLTKEEFSFIMEQRKKNINMVYEVAPSPSLPWPVLRSREFMKRHSPSRRKELSI